MISEAIINISVVSATCLLLVIYLLKFVLKYKHEYESNPLCTLTVLFCLVVVLLATFILPIDIFLVTFIKEPDGSLKDWATNATLERIDKAVLASYYSLYSISAVLIFIVIPFLHCLNEERETNSRDRFYNAVKFTFSLFIIMLLILGIGSLIQISSDPSPNNIFDKIIHLDTDRAQSALNMLLTLITMAGFVNITFYTASGLSSWPISLVVGTSSIKNRSQTMNDEEELLRLRISNLNEKARGGRLTPREQEQLQRAEEDLARIEHEGTILNSYASTWTYKLRKAIRPTQIVFGIIFITISGLIFATLIIVNIDRIMHSAGPKQGYILLRPTEYNPLEHLYQLVQNHIIIGPMPLLVLTCFLVVATISGIRNLGLWLLVARLYRVKVGRTQPQALLFFCTTMMLTALAFNLILYSLSSQYITFGYQNYRSQINGTWVTQTCTLENYNNECVLTRASILLMRMMSQVWIFGAIFFWWSWVFIVVGALSFIAFMWRGKRDATHGIVSNSGEFEE